MGKDLKGKELGLGVSQRKDGLYTDANVKGENIRCSTQLFITVIRLAFRDFLCTS
ncbi:MAG: hypothetical protein J6D08_07360 [Lachnospiraceae bacterium]|nr:hypothetical protein [Lachnospiraceae bacterium]